jgi:nicotinic acid mononucleotide adenylyltransferase
MARLSRESFVGHRLFFVAAGGGAQFQNDLWMVPGTSGFLVGAAFPYAQDDTDEFLGFKPEKYCSREEALQLAMEAYMRACRKPEGKPIGLALSAAVASIDGPPRRGDHRVFVAVITEDGAYVMKKTLEKDPGFGGAQRKRDNDDARLGAEDLLRIALGEWTFDEAVRANAHLCKCHVHLPPRAEIERVEDAELQNLFFKRPFFGQGGWRGAQEPAEMEVFYPGTFNPLHDGHRLIIQNVGTSDACYVVNVDSVHKPAMTVQQILTIAAQFRVERLNHKIGAVSFTRGEPLFIQKFEKRPEKIFVMGVDTLERMLDPKWGPDRGKVLHSIYENGIQIFVCDRIVDGQRKTAHDALKRLVPTWPTGPFAARNFHALDIEPSALSSSAIRAANGG